MTSSMASSEDDSMGDVSGEGGLRRVAAVGADDAAGGGGGIGGGGKGGVNERSTAGRGGGFGGVVSSSVGGAGGGNGGGGSGGGGDGRPESSGVLGLLPGGDTSDMSDITCKKDTSQLCNSITGFFFWTF